MVLKSKHKNGGERSVSPTESYFYNGSEELKGPLWHSLCKLIPPQGTRAIPPPSYPPAASQPPPAEPG